MVAFSFFSPVTLGRDFFFLSPLALKFFFGGVPKVFKKSLKTFWHLLPLVTYSPKTVRDFRNWQEVQN
jgi:hypothetical protein